MALSPEQQAVLRRILSIGRRRGESPKELKAAIETGLVESNLRNLSGGDADSAGWRQERASLYRDPTNLDASINRFFDETSAVQGKYQRAGDLAAAVQRPAAQYRGRYQERSGEADALLGETGRSRPVARAASASVADDSTARRLAVAQFLSSESKDPIDLALSVKALQSQQTPVAAGPPSSPSPAGASGFKARADRINAQKLPYKWGGGHAGKVTPGDGQPLDCSGAVSAVLGINPRVSGQFAQWGKPGDGGNRGVTVYSNSEHVLMKIDGKFFGTSASNPGGGAGWIPQSQISPEYLAGFAARHA